MADPTPVETVVTSGEPTIIKRWEAKFTTPNVACIAALVLLTVVHLWHPEFFGKAEVFVFLALAACGVQVSPFFRKVEQVIVTGDVTQLLAAKKKPSVPPLPVVALSFVVTAAALACGHPPPSSLPQNAASCGVDIFSVITTGNEDPMTIAKDCGLTLVQLIAYIDQVLSPSPGSATALNADKVTKLSKVRVAAVHRLVEESPGK